MGETQRKIHKSAVAVVGGAGFLGSHLVNYLIDELECEVVVIDNLITGRREYIHPKATFVHGDITGSEEFLKKTFERYKIEYVFNYAAEPYIPVSFDRPIHVFNINAFGALKVMNAAQDAGVKAILQVSSAEIYGEGLGTRNGFPVMGSINEHAKVTPHSSYGASKAAIDAMVQVRWKEAKTPVIALRQFNCVGERETHPYIIPEIISQIQKRIAESAGTDVVKRVFLGNNSFRDFQYAGDAVRMAVELLEKGNFGEVYNMGSEMGIQMYQLAKLIGEVMNVEIEVVEDPTRKRPWEIWHLQSDNTKLYSVIKTRPTVSLLEGLTRTVMFFQKNGFKWDF